MASYHNQLKALAESIGSDGCSHVIDYCIECCWEHDWAYATGTTPQGVAVTKEYADRRFRDCIQAHTSLRWFNPISWIRWFVVKKLGTGIWNEPTVQIQMFYHDFEFISKRLREAKSARERIIAELHHDA